MTMPRAAETPATSPARGLLPAMRYALGGRRALLILAGTALVAGLALNWSWLAAAGIAPLLLAVLPCVAMCALGLCMNKMAGMSRSTHSSARQGAETGTDDPAPTLQAATRERSPVPRAARLQGAAAPIAGLEPRPH